MTGAAVNGFLALPQGKWPVPVRHSQHCPASHKRIDFRYASLRNGPIKVALHGPARASMAEDS